MYLRKIVTTLIMKKINKNENEDCITSYLWSANKKKKKKKRTIKGYGSAGNLISKHHVLENSLEIVKFVIC